MTTGKEGIGIILDRATWLFRNYGSKHSIYSRAKPYKCITRKLLKPRNNWEYENLLCSLSLFSNSSPGYKCGKSLKWTIFCWQQKCLLKKYSSLPTVPFKKSVICVKQVRICLSCNFRANFLTLQRFVVHQRSIQNIFLRSLSLIEAKISFSCLNENYFLATRLFNPA